MQKKKESELEALKQDVRTSKKFQIFLLSLAFFTAVIVTDVQTWEITKECSIACF